MNRGCAGGVPLSPSLSSSSSSGGTRLGTAVVRRSCPVTVAVEGACGARKLPWLSAQPPIFIAIAIVEGIHSLGLRWSVPLCCRRQCHWWYTWSCNDGVPLSPSLTSSSSRGIQLGAAVTKCPRSPSPSKARVRGSESGLYRRSDPLLLLFVAHTAQSYRRR